MRKNLSNNITELMMAASKGELERAQEALLKGETQLDERDAFGNTALLYAAAAGHLEVVRLLLNNGADASVRNQIGMTASMRAGANGYAEVVELLERGASQIKQFPLGQRETGEAQSSGNQLIQSVRLGNIRQARSLLSGENVNARTRDGQTALHIATTKGDLNMMGLLLKNGIEIDACNGNGWTALWMAVSLGDVGAIGLLLEAGAEIDARDNYGWTPLMQTADDNNIECMKVLLESGADGEAEGPSRETALQLALQKGHAEAAELLKQFIERQRGRVPKGHTRLANSR